MFDSATLRKICAIAFSSLLAAPAYPQAPEVHEKCLKAADYKGCVDVLGGKGGDTSSPVAELVNAIRLLPSRISKSSRSSLFADIQPFSDALALVESHQAKDDYEQEVIRGARRLERLINILATTWSDQINLRVRYKYYHEPACENARDKVDEFNENADKYTAVYREVVTKVLWQTSKDCENPIGSMAQAIAADARDISEDREKKKSRLLKEKKERERAAMEPWERYLEENPDLKRWVEANPKAAEAEKKKFLKKYNDLGPADPSKPGCNIYGICINESGAYDPSMYK